MTKEFKLTLRGGIYCIKVRHEVGGQVTEYWRPMVCEEFITVAVGMGGVQKVGVIISDKEVVGGVEIRIQKQGYYRWSWRFAGDYYRGLNTSYGMYSGVEGILMGMFPNEWDRGEDKEARAVIFLHEHGPESEIPLWIRIEEI